MRRLFIALWACVFFTPNLSSQVKIPLDQNMLINVSTQGDASLLIDEQQLSGDPKNGTGGVPQTIFSGGFNSLFYPLQVIIDLGSTHQLSDIYVFDSYNIDTLTVYSGSPLGWQNPVKIYLDRYNFWKGAPLNTSSRYLMLEFPSRKANIAEIVIYGQINSSKTPIPGKTAHTPPLMESLIGINAVHNQPLEKLRCVGSVREYHPWQWDEGNGNSSYPGYPNNQFAWAPSWVSGPAWGWDFDQTYANFLNFGLDLSPCLQQTAPYMLDSTNNVEQKPISPSDDPENPSSYEEHSRYLFQFAARYGSTIVPTSQLLLKPGQPANSGLSLVKYVENWNEEDKWWRGRDAYFSPFEMAAMCSADYDGHQGSMGSGYGAKNADPNIKFVMGGLTILGLDYIKGMKLWSDLHRTNGFPADVLNFHHYSNISGGQDSPLKQAISPEDDNLKNKLAEIVDYRDRYLPGKEIWLSEFGYDTNPNSPQGARAIGQNDVYEVQGQWLIRSYLEIAAAGVDRAHVFFFADLNAQNPNKFNSSGLVNEKWNGFQPKTSWYYVYAFKKALTGYRFEMEITTQNPDVNIYKFHNQSTSTSIYAAWCNTSIDKTISNFEVNLGNALGATLLTLNPTDTVAIETGLQLTSTNSTLVNLSERPIFIRTVEPNSTSCITITSKDFFEIQLDKNGQATLDPADINNGSKSNCGPLSFTVSKNQFDCQDVVGGFYVEVHSDSSWMLSTVDDAITHQTFPWTGVSGNLPPTSSFTIPVTLGQPKSYKSIDNVPGSEVVKCDHNVTFYRKTFDIPSTSDVDFFAEMTVDDDMEIYLNGNLVAREESHNNSSSKLPSHRFETDTLSATSSLHESFDYVSSNATAFLQIGTNELILAIRNTGGKDNGGFSFRMGIGNPAAGGQKVIFTGTDNITQDSATASTHIQVVDILPPVITAVPSPKVYLNSVGIAAVNLNDLRISVTDNCQLNSVVYKPSTVSYTALKDSAIVEVVSDESWVKSTFSDSQNAFTFPWSGTLDLPDSTTYSIKASVGQPYSYIGIYAIPGSQVISTGAHVTFFKKTFTLNIDSIDRCWIDMCMDDDAEIYVNGILLAREGSFSSNNSQAPAHRIFYDFSSVQNGYQGGDLFDFVSGTNLVSLLNPNGENEIILAIRNGGNKNVGGFSFKLSIPLIQKNHISASVTATDKYGNSKTAYTSVEVLDTIAPSMVVTNNLMLYPNPSGTINLDPALFDNGSFDNTGIKKLMIYPDSILCGEAQIASLSAEDYFGNISTTNINLTIDTSLCSTPTSGNKKTSRKESGNSETTSDYPDWNFKAFPIPAKGSLNIDIDNCLITEDVILELHDLSGKLLISETKSPGTAMLSTKLNISELASGKYILTIRHQQESKTTKVLIN